MRRNPRLQLAALAAVAALLLAGCSCNASRSSEHAGRGRIGHPTRSS